MLGSKGAAGLKPCPLCQNVSGAAMPRGSAPSAGGCAQLGCDARRAVQGTAGSHEQGHADEHSWEGRGELRWKPISCRLHRIADKPGVNVRPWEAPVFHWVRDLFVSGVLRECKRHREVFSGGVVHQAYCLCSLQVFQKHTGLRIQAARSRKSPLSYDVLQSYLDQWGWPHAVMSRNGMKDFLSPKRIKSSLGAGTFQYAASEALSCMPVSLRLLPMIPNDLGK